MATAQKQRVWTGRRVSVAQYMRLPDDGNKYELFEGELVMSPSYFVPHGRVAGHVFAKLDTFVTQRSLGIAALDTDIVVPKRNTVLRPDVCFISKRRLSIVRGHIYGAPDLAVEVTSPNNWQNDVHFKKLQYERFGVREYWVLDIADRRNRAYCWRRVRGRFAGGLIETATLRSHLLKDFRLNLKEIWKLAAEGAP